MILIEAHRPGPRFNFAPRPDISHVLFDFDGTLVDSDAALVAPFVALGVAMIIVDATIVNVAVPTIIRELHARLTATPVADVIANHGIGIWQLALVHLGVATPPDEAGRIPLPELAQAGLAIDALAAAGALGRPRTGGPPATQG